LRGRHAGSAAAAQEPRRSLARAAVPGTQRFNGRACSDFKRIWDMAEKAKFVIISTSVAAIKDKAIASATASDLPKGVEAGIGSAADMVKAIGKGEKGFGITLTVDTMEVGKDGRLISAVIKGTMSEPPEDTYLANVTFNGKTDAPDSKRVEKDMREIARTFGQMLGKDFAKQIK
jgi:hypothetical protein